MCETPRYILPVCTLEKLICSECSGYLNTGPIKIKTNGENICGKCSSNDVNDSLIHNEAFEAVLNLLVFPCKYSHLGCIENYPFNDMAAHESTCSFRSYTCPADSVNCKWSGRGTQLPQHYRESHFELYMENPKFQVNLTEDFQEARVFPVQGLLFIIRLKNRKKDKRFWIRVEYVGPLHDAVEIKYKLVLHAENSSELQMIIKEQEPQIFTQPSLFDTNSAQPVDVNSLLTLLENPKLVDCNISFTIPNDLIKDIKDKLKTIKCPHCKVYMAPPIYQCESGHVICAECTGYKSRCKKCEQDDVNFTSNIDLERTAATVQLPCRWRNCKQLFGCLEIRKHEQKCKYKLFKCPRCVNWFGLYDQIYHHFQIEHATLSTLKVYEITLEGDLSSFNYYLVSYGQVFFCSLTSGEENEKNISVRYYGTPTFLDNFRYVVEVKHYDEIKKYELTKRYPSKDYYLFDLKIPSEELQEFGRPCDYIIAIRVLEKIKIN